MVMVLVVMLLWDRCGLVEEHQTLNPDPGFDPNRCWVVLLGKTHYFPIALVIMPPTLKKLEGHIGLGLSVCLCVRV